MATTPRPTATAEAIHTITRQAGALTRPQIAALAKTATPDTQDRLVALEAAELITGAIERTTWAVLAAAMERVEFLRSTDDEVVAVWHAVRNAVLGCLALPFCRTEPVREAVARLARPWATAVIG